MLKKVRLIKPHGKLWSLFLSQSGKYLKENWPTEFKDFSEEQIMQYYTQECIKRKAEGNRHFYFFEVKKVYVGFVNMFVSEKIFEKTVYKTLNIAEFCINPNYRRKHLGTLALETILKWAKRQQINLIWAEVDKDLEVANTFWTKQKFNRIDLGIKRYGYYWLLSKIIFLRKSK